MDIISAIAIYLLIWWVVLFMILPIGVENQSKEATGAPKNPRLKRKIIQTTLVAFVLWLTYYILVETGTFSLRETFGS